MPILLKKELILKCTSWMLEDCGIMGIGNTANNPNLSAFVGLRNNAANPPIVVFTLSDYYSELHQKK